MKYHATLVPLLLFSATFAATAADWPRWRGPDGNGISKETGWSVNWPADGPKQLWKAKVGTGYSSVTVSQGRACTMGNDKKDVDTVYCFDANTGKELWIHSYAAELDPKWYEGGPSSTPVFDGNRVYTLSKRGLMHCLDAENGAVIWSKDLMKELDVKMPTWGFASSTLIEGNLALLNFGSAGLALEKATGNVIWSSGKEESGYSTPVLVQVKSVPAIMMAIKSDVVAVALRDGQELWRFPWKTNPEVNAADPILSNQKVFVSSGYNHGAGLFNVANNPPQEIWQNKNMRNHFNSCVLWEGYLYGVDENQLRCLDFETGAVKWTDKSSGKGSLILGDGKLIVLSERGELMVAPASPEGFEPVARAQVLGGKCWSAPALANGKIYCRNSAGDVVCVELGGSAVP